MSKETTPKEKPMDKETHLENNVKLQTSHLEQLFDHAERYFEIELEKEHRDLFKSLVVKTILHKSASDELNGYYLEQSMKKSENQKVWDRLSKDKVEETEKNMTEQVIDNLEKN
jgi:hypothetical protein|tara:strand:+ start:3651 stop:3992 length:342 start_codon:yes stop_codon:yes gene_type:complete